MAVSRGSLPGESIARLATVYDIRVWPELDVPNASDLAAFIDDAEGLLGVAKDVIDDQLLDRCPQLRAVAIASTGSRSASGNGLDGRRRPASHDGAPSAASLTCRAATRVAGSWWNRERRMLAIRAHRTYGYPSLDDPDPDVVFG